MTIQEYTQLIQPIKAQLFKMAFRIVGNSAEAEDVVQEVFIKIWKKKDDLNTITNLEAWCMRVTKNHALDKLRSKHKKLEALPEHLDFKETSASPHEKVETSDTMGHIKAIMEKLPGLQKSVIELRDIDGHSYQEIAEMLEISLDKVRVYLFRARQTMKKAILESSAFDYRTSS